MTKTNLTYEQLIALAPKDRPFQVRVQGNAWNDGEPKIVWGSIDNMKRLNTQIIPFQHADPENRVFHYSQCQEWLTSYTGTFDLIDIFQDAARHDSPKPVVYNINDWVEINWDLASDFMMHQKADRDRPVMTQKPVRIQGVEDDQWGISYDVKLDYKQPTYTGNFYLRLPHYCVKRIESVKMTRAEIQERLGISNLNLEIID